MSGHGNNPNVHVLMNTYLEGGLSTIEGGLSIHEKEQGWVSALTQQHI